MMAEHPSGPGLRLSSGAFRELGNSSLRHSILWHPDLALHFSLSALDPLSLVVQCAPQMQTQETNSLIEQRKAKLAALRAKGIDPFKNKFAPQEKCAIAREKFQAGEYAEGQEVELAGRITAHREMGKSTFIDIKDQSGRIQVYA